MAKGFIRDLFSSIRIGGKMSEQGADKAGLTISEGVRFFFKAVGIAFVFYFLPSLAEFIITLKNS